MKSTVSVCARLGPNTPQSGPRATHTPTLRGGASLAGGTPSSGEEHSATGAVGAALRGPCAAAQAGGRDGQPVGLAMTAWDPGPQPGSRKGGGEGPPGHRCTLTEPAWRSSEVLREAWALASVTPGPAWPLADVGGRSPAQTWPGPLRRRHSPAPGPLQRGRTRSLSVSISGRCFLSGGVRTQRAPSEGKALTGSAAGGPHPLPGNR